MDKVKINKAIDALMEMAQTKEEIKIPASKAPTLLTSPIIPPRIKTNIIISTESITPITGALITSNNPCGCCSILV